MKQAQKSTLLNDVIVATDDERIAEVVGQFGGKAALTCGDFACGSERAAIIAREHKADYVLNIQGDEPLLSPAVVDAVAKCLIDNHSIMMSTACSPIINQIEADNPNNVKVVLAKNGKALYFSRSRIPYWASFDKKEMASTGSLTIYRHIGIYGFTYDFLQTFASLKRTPLEIAENLEQLRALENGYDIHCIVTEQEFSGIDTAEDLVNAEKKLKA
jgi:3-deoxy-manno-octulosonate cytidylyltransferase (CMP-KDO synthetase)